MADTDHVGRTLRWGSFAILLLGVTVGWYVYILPSPAGLIFGSEFWVDWRVYCLPCTVVGEPWGPAQTATVIRTNSILGGVALWLTLAFGWFAQIGIACAPVAYGLFRLSVWARDTRCI